MKFKIVACELKRIIQRKGWNKSGKCPSNAGADPASKAGGGDFSNSQVSLQVHKRDVVCVTILL